MHKPADDLHQAIFLPHFFPQISGPVTIGAGWISASVSVALIKRQVKCSTSLQACRHKCHIRIHSKMDQRSFFERSDEHTSELQSRGHLVCRLLLEKTK